MGLILQNLLTTRPSQADTSSQRHSRQWKGTAALSCKETEALFSLLLNKLGRLQKSRSVKNGVKSSDSYQEKVILTSLVCKIYIFRCFFLFHLIYLDPAKKKILLSKVHVVCNLHIVAYFPCLSHKSASKALWSPLIMKVRLDFLQILFI